jgi:hypothetical protein
MPEIKTNKISPATGTAFTIGDSGDTFTVPSGATIVNSGTATGFGGGKINQVIHTLKQDTFTFTTDDAWQDVTDMTCAITPSATDSLILVNVSMTGGTTGGVTPQLKVQRDIGGGGYSDCDKLCGTAAGSRKAATMGTLYAIDGSQIMTMNMTGLDNPATTSAVTYKVQLYADNVTTTTNVGTSGQDADNVQQSRYPNTITCMEVLA